MKLERIIQEVIEEYSKNQIIRLYHRVGMVRANSWSEIIKSVMTKGLEPYGNWEGEPIIWLSSTYDYYAQKGKFVLALDFDLSTNGENNNKYGIVFNGVIAKAYDVIPFEDMIVIKIPVIYINDIAFTNDDIIEGINSGKNFTPEKLKANWKPPVVYADLFNKYVQPHIGIPDFIDKLDPQKVKIIYS